VRTHLAMPMATGWKIEMSRHAMTVRLVRSRKGTTG
jgi:hypothetical protein